MVLAVVAATVVQGVTSFSLTQLLSKSAQRMIAELARRRCRRTSAGCRWRITTRTRRGVLVSRIMSDVEGVRNLIGTGLVDFAGGIHDGDVRAGGPAADQRDDDGGGVRVLLVFGARPEQGVQDHPADFPRARPKINAEVTGRLTESLGGVRVVKGYHAEEREEKVFRAGVQRLLDNVLQSLTATSLMSLSATSLMGIVGAIDHVPGRAADSGGHA